LLLPIWGWGQAPTQNGKSLLDLNGQVGLYTDVFASSNPLLSQRMLQSPPFRQRLTASLGINVWKIKIPFKVTLGLPLGGFGFGQVPKPSFRQYFQMPGNGLGFQPQYKSLKVFLGTHTPTTSKLTAGNVALVTGLGLQCDPLDLIHIKASYGITQAAVGADSLARRLGSYQRTAFVAQAGLGRPKEGHIYLNYVRVRDDTTAALPAGAQAPLRKAVDGAVASLDFLTKLSKRLTIQAEVAVSAFSKDQAADTLSTVNLPDTVRAWLDKVGRFFPLNAATKVGAAADARITYQVKRWNAGIKGTLYSPGFNDLLFWNQTDDRLDLTADFKIRLLKNRITASVAGGVRKNNLLNTKVEGGIQELYSANANILLSKALSVGITYSNFGLRTTYLDDAPIQRQLNQSLSINPSLILGKRVIQVISLNLSMDTYEDKLDALQGFGIESASRNAGFFHSLTLPGDLGMQISLNSFQNTGQAGIYSLWNATIGVQKGLWRNKLQTQAQLQWSDAENDPTKAGRLLGLTVGAKYKLSDKLNSVLNVTLREQNIAGTPVQLLRINHSILYNF
jgi:hypothetical protein